jgi:hypothetical protein
MSADIPRMLANIPRMLADIPRMLADIPRMSVHISRESGNIRGVSPRVGQSSRDIDRLSRGNRERSRMTRGRGDDEEEISWKQGDKKRAIPGKCPTRLSPPALAQVITEEGRGRFVTSPGEEREGAIVTRATPLVAGKGERVFCNAAGGRARGRDRPAGVVAGRERAGPRRVILSRCKLYYLCPALT